VGEGRADDYQFIVVYREAAGGPLFLHAAGIMEHTGIMDR